MAPSLIDALSQPYLVLTTSGEVELAAPWLVLEVEGEGLARLLAERFLIPRNGSVSDRLWRLVVGLSDEGDERDTRHDKGDETESSAIDACWLGGIPKAVWDVVRDSVLRCT